jgi:hypothetical protein
MKLLCYLKGLNWLLILTALAVRAQPADTVRTYVDAQGVWRWTDTGAELAFFGVNYTTPFAHAYRAHQQRRVDLRRAIEADVAHLARLRLNAFRIHVWDREITDQRGNLIENEHLDLLDYLIARLKAQGIAIVLTPIAWWGTGYPEPDPKTGGFSDYYTKCQLTADTVAWRIQANYLQQFIQHVNPYTGLAYRDDPDILAVEIFNEPCHRTATDTTTLYINTLVAALREAGLRKPIFYNISEGYHEAHGRAVCAADVQGITFQWYPTGLVRGRMLESNMLPNVDHYAMPPAAFPECQNKARLVYEFDAADVGGSYLYPAMARSFRAAGFQWATQFAYDPLFIADANTEYPTHYLNLVYTPAKALSLMIAAEAFRQLPRGIATGTYPESVRFGPFRVDAARNLSEMVTDTVFYYSNTTNTRPPHPELLRHVAGVGSSPVVRYEGSGAYFLDRLAPGVWRLEVYPDVFWIRDPFGRTGLHRPVARLVMRERSMTVRLPDLGTHFTLTPLNPGNQHWPAVDAGTFGIRPGVYLLRAAQVASPDSSWLRPVPFYLPPVPDAGLQVLHTPPIEMESGDTLWIQVVADATPDSVRLYVQRPGWRGFAVVRMVPLGGDRYGATLPPSVGQPGLLTYAVAVYLNGWAHTFPADELRDPQDWDFSGQKFWHAKLVAAAAPVVLLDPLRDTKRLLLPRLGRGFRFAVEPIPTETPGHWALRVMASGPDPEVQGFVFRTELPTGLRTRLNAHRWTHLRLRARAREGVGRLEVALVDLDGVAWATTLTLSEEWRNFRIPLQELQLVELALLPRPYPPFHPYFLATKPPADHVDPARLDGLQFRVSAVQDALAFEIAWVALER